MNILIYSDPHWSKTSSILRGRGEKYSLRLEKLIESVNWVESLASEKAVDIILCLGDFFDKSSLDAEEITALTEIKWNEDIPHLFLIGNHEMLSNDLIINSVNALANVPNCTIINQPMKFEDNGCMLNFIPYILECNREPLETYVTKGDKGTIVFSHNDVKGIQMGSFLSVSGFDIEEIDNNCDIFLNGHLHNGGKIGKNGLNLGNLTGQNFSEVGSTPHCAYILNTETLKLDTIDNPYQIRFIQGEYNKNTGLPMELGYEVWNLTCNEEDAEYARKYLESRGDKVLATRLNIKYGQKDSNGVVEVELNTQNHIEQFIDFVHANLGNDDIINYELQQICGGNNAD